MRAAQTLAKRVAPLYRVPENRNEVRFLGKRSRRHQSNRFARRANLCGICRTDLLGLPKIAGHSPRFLGKRSCRRLRKQLAPCASCCEIRRAPTGFPKIAGHSPRFLGKRSRRHQSNRFARRANLCGICRSNRAPENRNEVRFLGRRSCRR